MKIACDVNVSNKTISFLNSNGFTVVKKAGNGESDRSWFESALNNGAEIFISGDSDIAHLVEEHYDLRLRWLRFPSMPYDGGKVNYWILNRLLKIKEAWGV